MGTVKARNAGKKQRGIASQMLPIEDGVRRDYACANILNCLPSFTRQGEAEVGEIPFLIFTPTALPLALGTEIHRVEVEIYPIRNGTPLQERSMSSVVSDGFHVCRSNMYLPELYNTTLCISREDKHDIVKFSNMCGTSTTDTVQQ